MAEKNKDAASTADREIVLTRVFDAPRELVWAAWTDSKHVAHWWGPTGFTNTFQEFDMRVGGVWRFVMHGPDGRDYTNKITFLEIVKPERLVYDHGGDDDCAPLDFHVTVTFSDQAGKTRVTMRSLFDTAALRDLVVKNFGAIEGGIQHLGRLAEYLGRM